MATLKDIAKIAGVSHGTVSNVLNGKGNVSVEKIKLVEDAAKKLGYSINAQAKQLRKTSGFSPIVAVIVPNIIESKYSMFFSSIKKYFENINQTVLLFITDDMPYTEKSAVNTIATMRIGKVISVTCCLDAPEIYEPIERSGGQVLFVERKVTQSKNYIGFDFYKAGEEIAALILEHNFKTVGLMRGLDIFSNEYDFERGIVDRLRKTDKNIEIFQVETDLSASVKAAFNFLKRDVLPDVIVTTSEYLKSNAELAYFINSHGSPYIISMFPDGFYKEEDGVSKYYMNYASLGYEAAKCIDMEIEKGDVFNKIIPVNGFPKHYKAGVIKKGITLNAVLIKGQAADAIISMTPRFTDHTGIKMNFMVMPPNEMYEAIIRDDSENYFDIFRINMFMMPLFSQKKLIPLNGGFFNKLTKNMIPKIVSEFSYINDAPYAIPFDMGTQMLIYRKDLFEDTMNRRMYYEMYNKNLDVPDNFDDFNNIASFFTKKYNKNSPVEYGTSSSMSTNSGICTNFEIRYRGYGGDVIKSGELFKLDEEKLYRAMQNYEDYFKYSVHTYDNYWGGDDINNFIEGRTAMEIVFINYASSLTDLKTPKLGGRIGYSSIPGGSPSLGGGSLGVSSKCREPEAALEFIRWACGEEQSEMYTLLGGLSPHTNVFVNRHILNIYPWYSLMPAIIDGCVGRGVFNGLNIIEYEKLAGLILRNIINNIMSYEDGLKLFYKEIKNIMNTSYN